MKKGVLLSIVVALLCGFYIQTAYAEQVPIIPKPGTLPGPSIETLASGEATRDYFLERVLPGFVKPFLGTMGVISVLMLIIGGAQLLISYGDEETIAKAKKTIYISVISLVIALLSYSIVSIIVSLPLEKERPAGTSERVEEQAGE